MKKVILSRHQVEQLWKIADHFKDVQNFTLTIDHSSGIGPTVKVVINLFESNDTAIDITDVSNW